MITTVDLAAAADPGDGAVVVVDVLRAATTAAVALAAGAALIRPVRTVQEAFAAREADPRVLLLGEVDGAPVPGFDLSNSPVEVAAAELAGRVIVQRSSAGTQGLVAWHKASPLLFGALVNAAATAAWLRARGLTDVTFVATGVDERDGDEDLACADHLAALLRGEEPDRGVASARVAASDAARRFRDPADPVMPAADLELCAQVDLLDVVVVAQREGGALVLRGERVPPHHT